MRSPIIWFGGKGKFVNHLLPFVKYPHQTYVEVFGGGASLLFAKKPSQFEIYNDIDSGLVNLFRVIRDKKKFKEFERLCYLTPYSREEYAYARKHYETAKTDIERAYMFYLTARMSFSGRFDAGWGFDVCGTRNHLKSYFNAIELLFEIHQRIIGVQIENNSFEKIFDTCDSEDTLFYLDPPYVHSTRKQIRYSYEMTDKDHKQLIDIILNIKGSAFISGYQNKIYKKLESNGWIRKDYETVCYVAGKTKASGLKGEGSLLKNQSRTESIWIHPKIAQWIDKEENSLFRRNQK